MLNFFIRSESLSPRTIHRGEIKKYPLYTGEGIEIAVLKLAPGAKICKHEHLIDKEIYFVIETKRFSYCDVGESHELENTSETESIHVLSIKIAV